MEPSGAVRSAADRQLPRPGHVRRGRQDVQDWQDPGGVDVLDSFFLQNRVLLESSARTPVRNISVISSA